VTALIVIAILVFVALVAVGVRLMGRARPEPAARASGRAPDPAEEAEASRRGPDQPSVLERD